MANSIGNLIRELGDLALANMTREQLEEVALFDAHTEHLAFNLSRLTEGIGLLISQDAADHAAGRIHMGSLQGTDADVAFAAISDVIDIIGAVGYVSNFATHKLLRPATYGAPVKGKKHA